jgi:hypothetical protein
MLPEKYYFTRELLWRRGLVRELILKQVPDIVTVANTLSIKWRDGVSRLFEFVN